MTSYSFTLRQLEATFIALVNDPSREGWREDVATLDAAQGIRFLCPRCYRANGGPIGTHSILCWFAGRGVPSTTMPGPGRWIPNPGAVIETLTFIGPNAASVQSGKHWHGFVRSGHVFVDREGPQ